MAKFWKKPNGQTNGWLMAAEVGWPVDLALETNEAGQTGGRRTGFKLEHVCPVGSGQPLLGSSSLMSSGNIGPEKQIFTFFKQSQKSTRANTLFEPK